jgi:hypothetical protein
MIEIRHRLTPATIDIVVPEGDEFAQGFATARPIPVPSSNRNSEKPAAATPPAAIAAHDAADARDSSPPPYLPPETTGTASVTTVAMIFS